jgi:hypothetical protein
MIWAEGLAQLAAMIGEPEAASATAAFTGELDIPYSIKDHLENALLIANQEVLREVPEDRIEQLKAPVIIETTGGTSVGDYSFLAVQLDTVRIVSVQIDDMPAAESSIEGFFQRVKTSRTNTYSWQDGKIVFKGTNAKVVHLVEKALADWQGGDLLPAAFTEEVLMRAYERLMLARYLPSFRG